MIETDRGMPKYYFRSGIDDVVEWTREQLDSYLQREWETHLTERLASGNADDVVVRVMLSMNKRSSKAALRRDAAHRDEALAAIEQEGDQFIENRVLHEVRGNSSRTPRQYIEGVSVCRRQT